MKNVDRLIDLFDDESVSWDAARAVGRIPGADKILTKRHHAVVKVSWTEAMVTWLFYSSLAQILYAQKYTNSVLPRIVEGAKASRTSSPLRNWGAFSDQIHRVVTAERISSRPGRADQVRAQVDVCSPDAFREHRSFLGCSYTLLKTSRLAHAFAITWPRPP